jgi:hypothetical protein
MTGVKGFIRDSLPPHWEKALKDHKCLGNFVEQFYQAIAKPKNRNKYHYNVSIMQARHDIKNKSILMIASVYMFKEGENFWTEVHKTSINYELEWK